VVIEAGTQLLSQVMPVKHLPTGGKKTMKFDKFGALAAAAWIVCAASNALALTAFKHIVLIVQENRTPDNLFQGLCSPPFGSTSSCSTTPGPGQYDIQTSNWLDKTAPGGIRQPVSVLLGISYDTQHEHNAFVAMCDRNATGICAMDGAAGIQCNGLCPANPQFQFVDNSFGILDPYLTLATQYGWANYMFQTNQGSSFTAHQYLFGGTSAPTAGDDAMGIFAINQGSAIPGEKGCISGAGELIPLIEPNGGSGQIYPCFEHATLPDVLPNGVTWRYYATTGFDGDIWTAPIAIQHICQSTGPGGSCIGQQWTSNVDQNSADVLRDIYKCHLRSVSWVTPTGYNSDHAGALDNVGGPSWVAAIVDAIGTSTSCDGGAGYWNDTAIVIVWDDWGGWYDHEPPTILSTVQGDYERGFRVPLIFISAYTRQGYIDNTRIDFGSILRFIEHNFGLVPGTLDFADDRTEYGLGPFYSLTKNPRSFTSVQAPLSAQFFLNDKRPPTPPDDD
jgi:phospholipase C